MHFIQQHNNTRMYMSKTKKKRKKKKERERKMLPTSTFVCF